MRSLLVVLVLAFGAFAAEPSPRRNPEPAAPARIAQRRDGPRARRARATLAARRARSYTPAYVDSVVNALAERSRTTIGGCYHIALAGHPGLAGTLATQVTFDAGGRVSDVRVVTDSLRDPAMVECIVAEIRTWRTDPLPVAKTGTHTFTFGH